MDEPPALATPLEVEYPEEAQKRFGEREVPVTVALSTLGVAAATRVPDEVEPELPTIATRAVERLRFRPATVDGEPVPVILKLNVPLSVDMSAERVFDLSEVSTPPRAISMTAPFYPMELKKQRVHGRVTLEFILDVNGRPQQVRAIGFSHEAFAHPAINCVTRSRWQPAAKDGKPVPCRIRIPIEFKS